MKFDLYSLKALIKNYFGNWLFCWLPKWCQLHTKWPFLLFTLFSVFSQLNFSVDVKGKNGKFGMSMCPQQTEKRDMYDQKYEMKLL